MSCSATWNIFIMPQPLLFLTEKVHKYVSENVSNYHREIMYINKYLLLTRYQKYARDL